MPLGPLLRITVTSLLSIWFIWRAFQMLRHGHTMLRGGRRITRQGNPWTFWLSIIAQLVLAAAGMFVAWSILKA